MPGLSAFQVYGSIALYIYTVRESGDIMPREGRVCVCIGALFVVLWCMCTLICFYEV